MKKFARSPQYSSTSFTAAQTDFPIDGAQTDFLEDCGRCFPIKATCRYGCWKRGFNGIETVDSLEEGCSLWPTVSVSPSQLPLLDTLERFHSCQFEWNTRSWWRLHAPVNEVLATGVPPRQIHRPVKEVLNISGLTGHLAMNHVQTGISSTNATMGCAGSF